MEKIIEKVFNKKLQDGTIEKIVEKSIEDMVKSIMSDSMGWNGKVKKALQEKIEPIMLEAVDRSDVSKTVNVIVDLLNQAIKESPIKMLKDTVEGIKGLYGVKDYIKNIQWKDKVKLSNIFKMYCDLIKNNEPYSKSDLEQKNIDINYDDSINAYIGVTMEVEEVIKDRFWGEREKKYEITISNDLMEEEDKEILFNIEKSYDDTWRVCINTSNMLLAEIPHQDPFITYLMALEHNCCEIVIDTNGEAEDICVEVEE